MIEEKSNNTFKGDSIPFRKNQTIPERFADICRTYSNNIAIETEECSINYSMLEHWARKIACSLVKNNKNGTGYVVISLNKVEEMIACIIGTLIGNKIYVPVESTFGITWIKRIFEDINPDTLIVDKENTQLVNLAYEHGVPLSFMDEMLDYEPLDEITEFTESPNSVASVLYTSGSTGRPKGVVQSQKNILFHIELLTNLFKIRSTDKHTLLCSLVHDASTTDLYCSILNGATLNPFNLKKNGFSELSDYLMNSKPTLYHSVPTVFRELVKIKSIREKYNSVRIVILGGEPVRKEDVTSFRRHFSDHCLFVNGYGATETTGFVALNVIRKNEELDYSIIPIGNSLDGINIFLLDENGNITLNEGEIAVECDHISLGYINNDEATTKVYKKGIKNKDSRLYMTGDYGKYTRFGKIRLLGRIDRQSKIRGYRIELNEIESAIAEIQSVKQVAVCVENNKENGDNEIVAYLVIDNQEDISEKEISDNIKGRIPNYMMPSKIMKIKKMPLTNNNKIDYKKLLKREIKDEKKIFNKIKTEDVEKIVLNAWKQVLQKDDLTLNDHIFDKGANSLHVMRVHSLVCKQIENKIPLVCFFEYSTIGSFVRFLQRKKNSSNSNFKNIEFRMKRRIRKH